MCCSFGTLFSTCSSRSCARERERKRKKDAHDREGGGGEERERERERAEATFVVNAFNTLGPSDNE
jgi:hypothetical protein